MTIDIMELSKIIGALTVIFGVVAAIYKFIQYRLLKPIETLQKQMKTQIDIDAENRLETLERYAKKQYEVNSERSEELQIIISGLLACLKGLQELNCDGAVTEGIKDIESFIVKGSHKT